MFDLIYRFDTSGNSRIIDPLDSLEANESLMRLQRCIIGYAFGAVAVVCLLGYFLLGVEFTAEDVEEPFGKDGDDLELTRFCVTIRESVEEIMALPLEGERPQL